MYFFFNDTINTKTPRDKIDLQNIQNTDNCCYQEIL